MSDDLTVYAWRVSLRNEKMGFLKEFDATGSYVHDALDDAYKQLGEIRSKSRPDQPAYDENDFVCVAVLRRSVVKLGRPV